ncbi:MAG: alpha-L-fucosidase [Kiritimatiellaeota bacterium]|nr:alpha-L-fucosidase [Kiritimatiellota bacterium]
MSKLIKADVTMARRLAEEHALQAQFSGYRGVDDNYVHAGQAALERFWDWKFGIRIHWSVYSITGNGPESWPLTAGYNGTPTFRAQYEELYKWWNPSHFDANDWTDLMQRAGLRFFSFTTKHHDGFSLFATRTKVRRRRVHIGPDAWKIVPCNLHYSIMESPFKRDIVKELVRAARRRDLGVSLYFSHIDWFDSDFRIDQWNYQRDSAYTRQSDPAGFARMTARHREQLRELCTNYGPIDMLSLDMNFPPDAGIDRDLIETVKLMRRIQPAMLIRQRGIGPYGDYATPEGYVPVSAANAADGCSSASGAVEQRPWKVIFPGGKHFSHVWNDEYKPASWIIETLADVAAKGGVFQVGYGPGPDGRFDAQIVSRLEETGDWLKVNGEGIYATRPYRVVGEGAEVRYTRSKDGKHVYAIMLRWPAPQFGMQLCLRQVRARPGSAIRMLGRKEPLRWKQDHQTLRIELPEDLRDEAKRPSHYASIFKIAVVK